MANIGLLSGLLWGNAGFSTLRKVDLDGYDPRYDPTVVPISESGTDIVASIRALGSSYNPSLTSTNRHYSIKDYHSAYEAGTMTPTVVAEALLDLISKSPKHKNAFLEMQKERVIAAAEASTQRYKAGKALGMFDGVPVGVKGKSLPFCLDSWRFLLPFSYGSLDFQTVHWALVPPSKVQSLIRCSDEVDLQGYSKCLGSCQDFTSTKGVVTSWCVKKWEEAGVVIVGKLNMHELGLGMYKSFEHIYLLPL